MFSAYTNTFADIAVPVPGTSIGVDLTLGYLEQLLREPRRIETLDEGTIAHFQSTFAYYRRYL
jgi:hypothetical protein